jgi:aminopeptidase N
LCHRSREAQAVKYISPALDSLQYIQRTSDIFFPQNWTRTLLGSRYSAEALAQVEAFLNENPNIDPLLRSKILQAAWSLQRRSLHINKTKSDK